MAFRLLCETLVELNSLRRRVESTRIEFMESLATLTEAELKATAYFDALSQYREFLFQDLTPADD